MVNLIDERHCDKPVRYIANATEKSCAESTDLLRELVCGSHVPPPPPAKLPACRPLHTAAKSNSYYEVDALGSILYPEGVKLVVASLYQYFGNAEGKLIRAWAMRYGWALAWGKFPSCSDPRRLMDAAALNATTVNVSVTPSYLSSFGTAWETAEHVRANATVFKEKGKAVLSQIWNNLTNKTLTPDSVTLFNIGALDCSDGDNCIGMTRSGECACYQH